MKFSIRASSLVLTGFLFILLPKSAAAVGVGHGGGGDRAAIAFMSYGKLVTAMLYQRADLRLLLPVTPAEFANVVELTKVSSKDSLSLNGVEVDAINFPSSSQIVLNRGRWNDQPVGQSAALAALAVHEYLGILNIADSQYWYSTLFMKWLREANFPNWRMDTVGGAVDCRIPVTAPWALSLLSKACDQSGSSDLKIILEDRSFSDFARLHNLFIIESFKKEAWGTTMKAYRMFVSDKKNKITSVDGSGSYSLPCDISIAVTDSQTVYYKPGLCR